MLCCPLLICFRLHLGEGMSKSMAMPDAAYQYQSFYVRKPNQPNLSAIDIKNPQPIPPFTVSCSSQIKSDFRFFEDCETELRWLVGTEPGTGTTERRQRDHRLTSDRWALAAAVNLGPQSVSSSRVPLFGHAFALAYRELKQTD